ncbi:unnamed protein product [Protopolystoma xenopodis]|uniref:SH3 domain-containing protein n=1 Tax=Protopolystoma xenopodis TaxID=117903 RepID=A0A3S5C9C7_9PLAT|nr:unnamed protein product [Protopolystoma xenopodis]
MLILDSEPAITIAIAHADFVGGSARELSFRQGDEIILYRQLSEHWWEGQLSSDPTGTRGLIPALYVSNKAVLMQQHLEKQQQQHQNLVFFIAFESYGIY